MAGGPISPILIDTEGGIDQIRTQAYQEHCDELFGCARLVKIALSDGTLKLPIRATFPNPPDIVLSCGEGTIAVEVSRITWQAQSQVLAEAAKRWPGSLVELTPEMWADRQARPEKADRKAHRGKDVRKVERSGDYSTIRKQGEPFKGPGWIGDIHLDATIDALSTAVERKKHRLASYLTSAPTVWLFLIDDGGIAGAWCELFARVDLRQKVAAACASTGFDRVYLYQFSETAPVRIG